ncbi:MAG: hypothetical protein Q8N81_04185 [bacterium]|nr:hypothetical protein [bacterium]
MASFRFYTTLTGDELKGKGFVLNAGPRGTVEEGHAGKRIGDAWVELHFDCDKGMYYFGFETLMPGSVECSPLTNEVLELLEPHASPSLMFTARFDFRSLFGRVQGDYELGTARMRYIFGLGTVIYGRNREDVIALAEEFYLTGAIKRLVTRFADTTEILVLAGSGS